jgi:uncharacterized protein (TIGR04141 family)
MWDMNNKRSNTITVYLLKGSVNRNSDFLDKPESVSMQQLDNNTVLYYGVSSNKTPKWVDSFFGDSLTDVKGKIFSAYAMAVLIKSVTIEGRQVRFAVTFGQGGWQLLKKGSWEERFGLITTLNMVDDKTIRSLDKSNMGVSPKQSREQAIALSSMQDFGIDKEQDLIKSVTGKCSETEIGTSITGRDSLHISSKTNLSNLDDLLKTVYRNYKSDEYKEKYPWIGNISELRDKILIERLNNELVEKLNGGNYDYIWMAVPDIIDWNGVESFRYSADKRQEFKDLATKDFVSVLNSKGIDILSTDVLKSQKVEMVDGDGNIVGSHWSVYHCVYAEIVVDDLQYILNNSKWFLIDKDFKDSINDSYNEILDEEVDLPCYYGGEEEKVYNARFAADRSFVLMDRKTIPEFCDVYDHKNKTLYHIKRYGSSAPLSHLFNQGLVSAETMLSEKSYRSKVNKALGVDEFVPADVRPNAGDYKVVYGVISNSNGKLAIPFFSRVTLKHIRDTLQLTLGIDKVSLVKIKWQEK